MASSSSNLRTRMSAGNYKLACEIAVKRFKEYKVEISDAINRPFPFLEILRDRGFITNEMYKESKESCQNLSAVPKVMYAVFDNMEEKCHLPLLEILFSKVIMKNYPDLNGICEGFRDVIQRKIFQKASVGDKSAQNHNTQLSIEQGTGENPYPFLSWLSLDKSNYAVTSSADSAECGNRKEPPKGSTSALNKKPGSLNLRKPSTSGNKPTKRGFMDLGNNSAAQTPKKKRRSRQQPDAPVNFRAEILRVACGGDEGAVN
ncbi:nuclear autoantigen Sp-100-like isoform X2 [Phyllostomus hastatus]|uniref:nuclear autoantigen Sp-100-like isoform X2 n=1 Tax=Phyllostomus hastatus TaxID=9423 RepID=UPI001E67E0BB|nr:nuclear autoantigen Sp-100-like isoform X2 [Phyllostomus hastatus]